MSSHPVLPTPEAARKVVPSVADAPRPADTAALAPGLYIVATPIGNLRDISLRALDTLRGASLIACEDTRVTARLLHAYDITTRMLPYHEHNADAVRPRLLEAARTGAVALVSDAGTPLISDPGYKLVRAACADGIPVTTLPGASAVMAALTLAALPTDRFLFAGFLPNKTTARRAALAELAHVPATLVFFDSPQRILESLEDLQAVLGNRTAALTRELTKFYEQVLRGTLAELIDHVKSAPPRGEIVLVVAPPDAAAKTTADDLDALLTAALARLSVKDAAAEIASVTGTPKRDVYARALVLARPA
jgi:16S rRNA (cytidine1402-2'-O)-methyltransferase